MRTSSFVFGTFIVFISCLTDVSICLPDAYGCKIVLNTDAALAKPQYNNQQPQPIYSCTPVNSSTQYEVHVLGVYEANTIHRRPPVANDATVEITSHGNSSDRPIILVLGSYEPVNWILNLPAGINITKVILVAYYVAESNVSGDVNQVQAVERKAWRDQSSWSVGFGTDSGGMYTTRLLKKVYNRFGVVTSFTGTYTANEWSLMLSNSSSQGSGFGNLSSTAAPNNATVTSPTPTSMLHRQKCGTLMNRTYCPGVYTEMHLSPSCSEGYCVCSFQDYDYYTCLPDAYGCKIVVNAAAALAKPQYNNQSQTDYSCMPVNSSTQYEVHVLAVYEAKAAQSLPRVVVVDATVNIVSQGKSDRPIILVLVSYEPVNWILNLPADVKITKVILVGYHVDNSSVSGDVNQVQAVERMIWHSLRLTAGFGSDSGGGDTPTLLKRVYNRFGVVTSFTGTYRANEWSLMLSSSSQAFTSTVRTSAPTTSAPTLSSSECSNYKFLNESNRAQTYNNSSHVQCDVNPSGWYRFAGGAGNQMPESCVNIGHCGTRAPGWLNGSHPAVADGTVKRKVCFHWPRFCCLFETQISVRNCGAFYVYKLTPPRICDSRYCGNGLTPTPGAETTSRPVRETTPIASRMPTRAPTKEFLPTFSLVTPTQTITKSLRSTLFKLSFHTWSYMSLFSEIELYILRTQP